MKAEQYFTVQDLAQRWRVCEDTVRRQERTGRLQSIRVGRAIRFAPSDVIGWERKRRIERAKKIRRKGTAS